MMNFLFVRAACGLGIPPSWVKRLPFYVHERITHCLRDSFLKIKNSIVTCFACRERNKCVVHTWPVLTRHFISLTVKRAHNSDGPYWASSCYALTTHGFLTDQHPTAAEINSRSPHLHAITTGERVRTPYVNSACMYGLRAITWHSHGDFTL